MESLELPQMDPRVLKATSVQAGDPAAQSPEPQALKITAARPAGQSSAWYFQARGAFRARG